MTYAEGASLHVEVEPVAPELGEGAADVEVAGAREDLALGRLHDGGHESLQVLARRGWVQGDDDASIHAPGGGAALGQEEIGGGRGCHFLQEGVQEAHAEEPSSALAPDEVT